MRFWELATPPRLAPKAQSTPPEAGNLDRTGAVSRNKIRRCAPNFR